MKEFLRIMLIGMQLVALSVIALGNFYLAYVSFEVFLSSTSWKAVLMFFAMISCVILGTTYIFLLGLCGED